MSRPARDTGLARHPSGAAIVFTTGGGTLSATMVTRDREPGRSAASRYAKGCGYAVCTMAGNCGPSPATGEFMAPSTR